MIAIWALAFLTNFICKEILRLGFSLFSVDSGDQKIKTFCTFFDFSKRPLFGFLFGAQLRTRSGSLFLGIHKERTTNYGFPAFRPRSAIYLGQRYQQFKKAVAYWRLFEGNNWEQQRLFELGNNWEQKRPPFWRQNIGSLLDNLDNN